jgi:hypothetical protein
MTALGIVCAERMELIQSVGDAEQALGPLIGAAIASGLELAVN